MNIINSSVFMKSEPSETSTLETECLFGETVEILDESLDWVYCKLNTDSYQGWVKIDGLGKIKKPTHRVLAKRSLVYEERNPKSNILLYLPLGSQLAVNKIQSEWAEICLCNNSTQVG